MGAMGLERRYAPIEPDPEPRDVSPEHWMEYIYPLEKVTLSRSTDFKWVRVPTEEGEMLLEFLKRHWQKKD